MRTDSECKRFICSSVPFWSNVIIFLFLQIDADPDVLPRTNTFGLDYLAFVEMVPLNTPPTFLRLAFDCCVVSGLFLILFFQFNLTFSSFPVRTEEPSVV